MTLPATPWRILIVAALAVLGLIGLAVTETRARDAGVEAIFPMQAVDPRSLLSGHYVIVSLQEILPDGEACPTRANGIDTDFLRRSAFWLSLKPDGARTRVLGVEATRGGAAALGGIPVNGWADCGPQPDWRARVPENAPSDAQRPEVNVMRLNLGIERFHINQDQAMRIETLMRERGENARVSAILSLGQDGRARLKGLIVDQERLMLSW